MPCFIIHYFSIISLLIFRGYTLSHEGTYVGRNNMLHNEISSFGNQTWLTLRGTNDSTYRSWLIEIILKMKFLLHNWCSMLLLLLLAMLSCEPLQRSLGEMMRFSSSSCSFEERRRWRRWGSFLNVSTRKLLFFTATAAVVLKLKSSINDNYQSHRLSYIW